MHIIFKHSPHGAGSLITEPVFAVRSKGSQELKLSSYWRRLWSDWADVISLVLSCTGGYPTVSHYQCQQTQNVHNKYSWYSSRQTSITTHSAFLRNKSIAYLKNNIEQTAVILSLQERVVVFAGKVALKLLLQWLCIFKLSIQYTYKGNEFNRTKWRQLQLCKRRHVWQVYKNTWKRPRYSKLTTRIRISIWIHMTTVRALTYKPLPTEQINFGYGPSHKPVLGRTY